jgi:hypothetical protein
MKLQGAPFKPDFGLSGGLDYLLLSSRASAAFCERDLSEPRDVSRPYQALHAVTEVLSPLPRLL